MRSIHIFYLFLAVALQLVSFVVKGLRWGILLVPFKQCKTMLLAKITLIGLMLNNILPGRIGELGRAYMLGRKNNMSKSLVLSTIVTERIIDALVVLLFLVVVSLITPVSHLAEKIIIYTSVIFAGLLSFLFFLKGRLPRLILTLEALMEWIFKRKSATLTEMVRNFFLGFQWSVYRELALKLFSLSFLYWGIICLSTQFVVWAFHLPIPFYVSIIIVGITSFGMIIPSSPGYLGTYHFLVVNILLFFNIDKSDALSFAVIAHSIWYLLEIFFGLTFFWQENLDVGMFKAGKTTKG